MRLLYPIAALLLFTCATLHAAESEIDFWRGALGPGDALPLELRISGETATADFPTMGQSGYVGRVTRRDSWTASIPTPSGALELQGRRDGANIEGDWSFLGRRGRFALRRALAPRPAWREEAVAFVAPDGTALAGVLLLPRASGPHPGLVGVHGSGAETRAGANRYLAERLAAAGAAILLFDKRGTGGSDGDWRQASLEALAGDVEAGFDLLASRGEVDRCRLGLFGASQAAWVSAIVAARRPDVRFLMMRSGVTTDVAEEGQFDYLYRLADQPESVLAEARRILDLDDQVTRTGQGWEELQRLVREHADDAWFRAMEFEPAPPDHPGRLAYRRWLDFDPLPFLRASGASGLWIFGGADETVPTERSAAILRTLGPRHEVMIIPRAWHSLHYPPEAGQSWPRLAPEYPQAMLAWYRRNVARARCPVR